jgi:uncharacterized damage-inducible protein DinB
MIHPLVIQLRFTRSEFARAFKGVNEADAQKRLLPMNSIGWCVGHLAWQEQRYFLGFAKGVILLPDLEKAFAYGTPASTPPLKDVVSAWRTITAAADPWLDAATTETLQSHVISNGKPIAYLYGNLLQRVIYHYWYHTGEIMAIRQQLGHTRLPQFVGNIDDKAPYTPDTP